jgi:hypothetical protein
VFSKDTVLLLALGAAGALVGIGQLLSKGDKITTRLLIARAIMHGALGVCAAAVTIVIPGVSFAAQVGLACVLASIGTSAVESLFQKVLSK